MKWDLILNRLKNKEYLAVRDRRRVMQKIRRWKARGKDIQTLLMIKGRYETELLRLAEAMRYVKRNRGTYHLRRVEKKFKVTLTQA